MYYASLVFISDERARLTFVSLQFCCAPSAVIPRKPFSKLQGVVFALSMSTITVTEALPLKTPANAGNLEPFFPPFIQHVVP